MLVQPTTSFISMARMQNDVLLGYSRVAEGQVSVVRGTLGFRHLLERIPLLDLLGEKVSPATDTRR